VSSTHSKAAGQFDWIPAAGALGKLVDGLKARGRFPVHRRGLNFSTSKFRTSDAPDRTSQASHLGSAVGASSARAI